MAIQFKPATKTQAKARIALAGVSGSGKTFTALLLAQALGSRVAVVDTERGSASKYAGDPGIPEFDVIELESFSPALYMEAIEAAEQAGYDVLILDSISHAWSGKDGILEQVDLARAKSKSNNAFTDGWRQASPLHNKFVDRMLASKLHLIATMRSKTEYVLEDRNGQKIPKKVGMEMIQRAGMEYEFDVMGELDVEHTLVVTKSRCRALDGKVLSLPGTDLGRIIAAWVSDGAPIPEPPTASQLPIVSPTEDTQSPHPDPIAPTPVSEQPPRHRPTIIGQIRAMVDQLRPANLPQGDGSEAKWEHDLLQETFGHAPWQNVQARCRPSVLIEGWKRLKAQVGALQVPSQAVGGDDDVPMGEAPDSPTDLEDANEPTPGMASPDGIADVRQLAAGIGALPVLENWGDRVTLSAYTDVLDYCKTVTLLRELAWQVGGKDLMVLSAVDGDLARWHAQGKMAPTDTLKTLERNLHARAEKGDGA